MSKRRPTTNPDLSSVFQVKGEHEVIERYSIEWVDERGRRARGSKPLAIRTNNRALVEEVLRQFPGNVRQRIVITPVTVESISLGELSQRVAQALFAGTRISKKQ
jgi:hypothetical protein